MVLKLFWEGNDMNEIIHSYQVYEKNILILITYYIVINTIIITIS